MTIEDINQKKLRNEAECEVLQHIVWIRDDRLQTVQEYQRELTEMDEQEKLYNWRVDKIKSLTWEIAMYNKILDNFDKFMKGELK